jgi:hypothetical protein
MREHLVEGPCSLIRRSCDGSICSRSWQIGRMCWIHWGLFYMLAMVVHAKSKDLRDGGPEGAPERGGSRALRAVELCAML